MPRPKVKPEDRVRSTAACVPCKASKTKCDAFEPCGPCIKHDRVQECRYLPTSRAKRKRENSVSTRASEELGNGPKHGGAVQSSGQDVSTLTESRMLYTPRGERVYVGETASLSFLEFLRQVLKKFMGPSSFTEKESKDHMLDIEAVSDNVIPQAGRSHSQKVALVQLYREASSGVLDLYTVAEIERFLDQHNALSPGSSTNQYSRPDQAALNMMLAIGCQCRGNNPVDSFDATRYFASAQQIAFEGFLSDPSIDMVRIFTMMAFYMAQACKRNAAYMYTGIASKAACTLGLHRKEQYRGLPRTEALKRWRTWKTLVILDTIISAILGRPGSISSLHPDDATNYNETQEVADPDRTRWLASRAAFTICSHILDLQQGLGTCSNVNSSTAEKFLERLRQSNAALPEELRHFDHNDGHALGTIERERFMGATHVACLYYFTTILVTRPFLIMHLMSSLGQRYNSSPRISDLALACLQAALYLAKTGHTAVTSSLLSNNMCLLKAWMFAAGLVLGFSMFTDAGAPLTYTSSVGGGVTRADVDTAFDQAADVLTALATASPQARHYREILGALKEAVEARRQQLCTEKWKKRKNVQYVDQIFTAEFNKPTPARGGNNDTPRAAVQSQQSQRSYPQEAVMVTGGEIPPLTATTTTPTNMTDNSEAYDFDPAGLEFLDMESWNEFNIPMFSDNFYL